MSVTWTPAGEYEDIRYELSGDGIAKITIDRPEVRNAFRPETVIELMDAFERAREDTSVGAIILTGDLRRVGFGVATGTFKGQDAVSLATADFST